MSGDLLPTFTGLLCLKGNDGSTNSSGDPSAMCSSTIGRNSSLFSSNLVCVTVPARKRFERMMSNTRS